MSWILHFADCFCDWEVFYYWHCFHLWSSSTYPLVHYFLSSLCIEGSNFVLYVGNIFCYSVTFTLLSIVSVAQEQIQFWCVQVRVDRHLGGFTKVPHMSLFALKCPSVEAILASVILIFPCSVGGFLLCCCLCLSLHWADRASFSQGRNTEEIYNQVRLLPLPMIFRIISWG